MNTRLLTQADADDIYDLMLRRYIQLSKNNRNARTADNIDLQYDILMEEHTNFSWNEDGLPNNTNAGRIFGMFENDSLKAILTQRFSSTRMPVWYVGNMITDPEMNTYYKISHGIASCLDMAVEEAEKYGYTQFFWITSTKAWNKREEIWYNACKTFKRYNVFIENIIPANTLPKFDLEKAMMGYRLHPETLAIKTAKIKPHLRHEYFQKKGLLNADYIPLQEIIND